MEIDFDKLVCNFTNNHFGVKTVHYNAIDPGSKGFEKTAPFPGFILPISGTAEYSFNDTPYISEVGTIIHGGANMDLGKEVIGDSGCENIVVLYDVNYLDKDRLNLHDMHFKLDVRRKTNLTSLIWKLKNVSDEKYEMARFKRENIFRAILEEIFTGLEESQDRGAEFLFKEVSSYIHSNYMEDISVRELAEKNEVSENQLFYAFNKYAGVGAGQYIKQYRLNCAKKLLIHSENTICVIGESVGYSDSFHFSRMFKKNFGMAPSLYREKFRNDPCSI